MKYDIPKNYATAQLNFMRLMLDITTFVSCYWGVLDISRFFDECGPIKRQI